MFANIPFSKKIPHLLSIIPVYFVIIEVSFTINYYIIFNDKEDFSLKIMSIIFFEPCMIMTTITHLKSMFTCPGFVPIPFKNKTPINISSSSSSTSERYNNQIDNSIIFCQKCNNQRPPRAHHCKICGKCVLKMDHHCPWIANCVGYYNQKNFYQFLFYATLGDFIAFLLLIWKFSMIDTSIRGNVPQGHKITSAFKLIVYMWRPIQIVISILCSLAMTISIGTLLHKQTQMLLNNQTTIEKKLFEDWRNSPYYEPDKVKSFSSVMGYGWSEWFSLSFEANDPYNFEGAQKYYNLESL